MRRKINMCIPRYIVRYLDHIARMEGSSRSDVIRSIIGLSVAGSTSMAQSDGGGVGCDIGTRCRSSVSGEDGK